jgi:hypothetical protein
MNVLSGAKLAGHCLRGLDILLVLDHLSSHGSATGGLGIAKQLLVLVWNATLGRRGSL